MKAAGHAISHAGGMIDRRQLPIWQPSEEPTENPFRLQHSHPVLMARRRDAMRRQRAAARERRRRAREIMQASDD